MGFSKRRRFVVLLLAGAVLGVGIGYLISSAPQPHVDPNPTRSKTAGGGEITHVVLISIDTCRADRLGCYGYRKAATPHIDAVAAAGTLFENVVSPVPMTLPAHSSMLTGTIPPYHGVHTNLGYRLGKSNVTLSELLKEHGFATGAVIASFVMDSQFGINQGFDTYDDQFVNAGRNTEIAERRGGEVSRQAAEWLQDHRDGKSFLFLHYYDPHDPYAPPEPFASRFASDLYDGEIAYADQCVGQVIEKLKELEIYDSTLLIITSDHGEMLGAHGEGTHSYYIYEPVVRVPLIVKIPGQPTSRRVTDLVGIIDIMPTVCGLLGLDGPTVVHGEDLTGLIEQAEAARPERSIYCESLTPTNYDGNSLLGVVTKEWKYIQTTRPELYDLQSDPGENINLADEQPHRAKLLEERLRQHLEGQLRDDDESKAPLDENTRRRLESLGYVGGAANEDFQFDQSKDDPKDLFEFHNRCRQIEALIKKRRLDQAQRLCEGLLAERPSYLGAYVHLAKLATAEGDFVSAAGYFEQSLRQDPDQPRVHNSLALAHLRLGRHTEAVRAYQQAIRLDPQFAEAHYNLGLLSSRLGKSDLAIESFRTVLQLDPGDRKAQGRLTTVLISRGQALLEQGDLDLAKHDFLDVLRLNPSEVAAENGLAEIADRQQRRHDAIVHLQNSLRIDSHQPKMHENLVRLYANQGQSDELIRACQEALKIDPDSIWMLQALALAYANDSQLPAAIETGEKALSAAQSAGQTARVAEIEKQLASLRAAQSLEH